MVQFKRLFDHGIRIVPSSNGGIHVEVGCAMLVYTSTDDLLRDLAEYFRDPEGVAKKYTNIQVSLPNLSVANPDPPF